MSCLPLDKDVGKRKRLANASGKRFRLRLLLKRESLQPCGGSTLVLLEHRNPNPNPVGDKWGPEEAFIGGDIIVLCCV